MHVAQDYLDEHGNDTFIRFHFGHFGWCRVVLPRALKTYARLKP